MGDLEFFASETEFVVGVTQSKDKEDCKKVYQVVNFQRNTIEWLLETVKGKRNSNDEVLVIHDFLMFEIVSPMSMMSHVPEYVYGIRGCYIKDTICSETLRKYKVTQRKIKIKNILKDD